MRCDSADAADWRPAGVAEELPYQRHVDGRAAEDAARRYLERQDLEFIAANVRTRGGELDLVMLDGEVLVFVEVRYRRSTRYGGAAASVDYRKQRKLLAAGALFLQFTPALRNRRVRFDVVAVQPRASGGLHCEWLKDAFRS
jgi:putative endonuclease